MRAAFFHDHIFEFYNGDFYSPGKLPYSKLSEYLQHFSELNVYSRCRYVEDLPVGADKATGDNISITPLPNLSSIRGILDRRKVRERIINDSASIDFFIIRLPSEVGLVALDIAIEYGINHVVEMVACPFRCLHFRGDLAAKIYAPILRGRVKRAIRSARNVIYVTDSFLQNEYPTNGRSFAVSDAVI